MDFTPGGNFWIRPNRLEKIGAKTLGHTHNFDHVTWVVEGAIEVIATLPNGTKRTVTNRRGDLPLLIKADCTHEITALEPNTVYWCCYAHRDPQSGDVVQYENGNTRAYV